MGVSIVSKLKELIQQLCPNGVEYKKLGEIATISRGGSFQKKDYVETGVPCIHYGQIYTQYNLFVEKTVSFISDEKAKKQKMAVKNDIIMAVTSENIDDVCKCIAWLGEEKVAVSGHTAIIHHNINPKYLVYYLHSSMFHMQKTKLAHGTKVIEVTPDKLLGIVLPVPPIEIQSEIVRLLDSFSELTLELTLKLALELTTRKKQYEYYRNILLDPNTWANDKKFKRTTIGECCDTLTGFPFDSSQFSDTGIRLMRGMNVKRGYLDFSETNNRYWKSSDGVEKYLLQNEDIIIAMDGSLVGRSFGVIQESDLPLLLVQRVARIRSKKINIRYLYHCIAKDLPDYTDKKKTAGAVPHISLRDIKSFPLALPSLEEQGRIAQLLDSLESLHTYLSWNLPREIEARQKQYEYYRDKLLTFKQLS